MGAVDRVLVSTCGISVFTGRLGAPVPEVSRLLKRYANAPVDGVDGSEEWKPLREHTASVRRRLRTAAPQEAADASAEIKGILHFYGRGSWPQAAQRDTLVLLYTDTYLGSEAAAAVSGWLESQGVHARSECMRGLNTASTAAFEAGMIEVVEWCKDTHEQFRRHGVRVVYNLSGGFKSWQGYMTALGMLYADELVYIFEEALELIRIPRLPITLDPSEAEQQFALLRRMHVDSVPAVEAQGLREALRQVSGERATLSVLGELLFLERRDAEYRSRLLPSPHPRVRFGPELERSARQWNGTRQMEEINRRMDDLVRWLLGGQPLHRLDAKRLQGDPCPPSTHEFDLWADGGAWRGFYHQEQDGVVVVDRVGPHLR
jgi:putative CRISPR-associated protein (TIGR02619 family)